MLSSWTISSLTIEDLSTAGAPRFGTHIAVFSLLYSLLHDNIPIVTMLSIVSEAIPYPTGLRDFLASINTKLGFSR